MEDDDQNDQAEDDEEDDKEEGEHVAILMHAANADDGATLMEAGDAEASMEQAACFNCTECDVTLANLRNFKKHQQSKKASKKNGSKQSGCPKSGVFKLTYTKEFAEFDERRRPRWDSWRKRYVWKWLVELLRDETTTTMTRIVTYAKEFSELDERRRPRWDSWSKRYV